MFTLFLISNLVNGHWRVESGFYEFPALNGPSIESFSEISQFYRFFLEEKIDRNMKSIK